MEGERGKGREREGGREGWQGGEEYEGQYWRERGERGREGGREGRIMMVSIGRGSGRSEGGRERGRGEGTVRLTLVSVLGSNRSRQPTKTEAVVITPAETKLDGLGSTPSSTDRPNEVS